MQRSYCKQKENVQKLKDYSKVLNQAITKEYPYKKENFD